MYGRTAVGSRGRVWAISMLILGSVLGSSCATIVHGRGQHIRVTSNPAGASVYVGNDLVAVTPGVLFFSRRDSNVLLRFEKEGYRPAEATLERVLSRWILGDAGWGATQFMNQGLSSTSRMPKAAATVTGIGLGIDFATGAAYELIPSHVSVTLTPVQPAMPRRGS